MNKCKIGILMATYNGEKFLNEQIYSILNQTYKNWQLIIHDDSSIDSTVEIIKKFTTKYPDKIIFINDGVKCGGAKENFSHLVDITNRNFNFEYVMFSDQDDVWISNKIEITLNKMYEMESKFGKNTPILLHTDLKVVDENLNLISNSLWKFQKLDKNKKSFNYLLVQNNITGCSMMINKKLLKLSNNIPKQAIMHDWWIGLIASSIGIISYINKPTVFYRQHMNNDTGAKRMDINYVISKLKDKNSIIDSVEKTLLQAKAFKKNFYEDLSIQQKLILDNYILLKNKGSLEKLFTVIKYKFLKQDILRNIGFFYYLCKYL